MSLRKRVESLREVAAGEATQHHREILRDFREALNAGSVRAAEPGPDGSWVVNSWVKQGILSGFTLGVLSDMSVDGVLRFFDKDTYPTRPLDVRDGVRVVPGGSSIRDGCYVAPGVVCMPPMYVNVGAYVDQGTMIDSHALVGSCAQIGKRVHLSAAAQIGGVLEPVGAMPVIIEDDVMVGGGAGIFEGTIVRSGAVLAPGTHLTGSTPLYDLVRDTIHRRPEGGVLEIPERAVVVPGTRPARGEVAERWGISLYAPIIVKYRDGKTDAATLLEEALRC
jgi:2,3,4,5-tetrahydropyridine-2-carboxylate N-succinyltransferase